MVVSYATFRTVPIAVFSVRLLLLLLLPFLLVMLLVSMFTSLLLCGAPFLFLLRNHPLASAKATAVIGIVTTIEFRRESNPSSSNSL
ncbi:hypothetical protein B9Y57_13545 [Stenotrophomonas maltophilia]|nr:hypothetical protein B9Y57_13545 [Stenotrophomonas maltophilia]